MAKIAYIGIKGLPSKGGAERVVEAIVKRISNRHELTVYCSNDYNSRDTTMPGVRLVHLPTLGGKHLKSPSLFLLSSFHALLFGNYDIINIHNVEASFVLPLLRLKYKIVATSHGGTVRGARSKWGSIAKKIMAWTEYPFVFLSNVTTSVSETDSKYFKDKYNRKVVYIPNGVEKQPVMDRQVMRPFLKSLGVEDNNYILFAAGRIDPTKGCHLLIEAFQTLNLDMKVVIVGDLNQEPEYGKKMRQIADERFVFVPFTESKEKLFGIVQSCRIFVFPSIKEAMSMMLMEVASLGVPLISSDIPENKSVLGKHGVYFQSEDSYDLARKLNWAIDNPMEIEQVALEARKFVEQAYSWDKISEIYDQLYQKLYED